MAAHAVELWWRGEFAEEMGEGGEYAWGGGYERGIVGWAEVCEGVCV